MITDAVFAKQYDFEAYNCFHFLCEMLEKAYGKKLSYEDVMRWIRGTKAKELRIFERIPKPREGCVCVFHNISAEVHVGLFYRGRVLHIQECGVRHHPLHYLSVFYRAVRFYEYRYDS